MNEVLRVEMEAVRHDDDGVQVVRDDSPIDGFAIYLVCAVGGESLISGVTESKLFVSRYVTEHVSQEDAYSAAVALARCLDVIFQNNVPKERRFVQQYPTIVYQKPQENIPAGRVFFYEHHGMQFDIAKYQVADHLLNRTRRRSTHRPGFVRELAMDILREGDVITGNDKVCAMDGFTMLVHYYSSLVEVIQNNNRYALIDCCSRELVQGAPTAALDDYAAKRELEAFARFVNA